MAQSQNFEQVLHVVVVDDEEAILTSIKSLFRKLPYKFRFFTTPAAAMQVVKTSEVDVVVSDLRMQDSNGIEFMKDVAGLKPLTTRVLMSGFEDKSIVLLALSAGLINDFIYKPWDDGEFRELLSRIDESQNKLKRRDDKDILYEFEDLPTPPKFHERLSEMLASLDAPISKIVQEIELSPALVAKLIRVANSVHLGIRKRVTSVKDAVFFIGLEYIASMVTALEAFDSYSSKVPARYSALVEEMTTSSVRRGILARDIAPRWPGLTNKYVPYVSALLQDIGLFARVCLRPEQYDAFLKLKGKGSVSARDAEREAFGQYSHEQIGGAILDRWNFPSDIVKTVACHHASPAPDDYVRIVQLANMIDGDTDDFPRDEDLRGSLEEWKRRLAL